MNHRQFTIENQQDFATLSGDFNPLHIDHKAARRLIFGELAVHGVHALIWGLDTWLAEKDASLDLRSLKVRFLEPIPVANTVVCKIVRRDAFSVTMQLTVEGKKAVVIKAEFSPEACQETLIPDEHPARALPRNHSAAEASTKKGELPLLLDRKLASRLFPNATKAMSSSQLAAILATTRLVGMECPGLHSTYSELNLRHDPNKTAEAFEYRVSQWDDRFNLLSIDISSPNLSGTIQTFVRPSPTKQASLADVRQFVDPGEFSQQTALVVGGSRGIGEVTAKLLAAGGAKVQLTYCEGRDDAQNVVDDICNNGGNANCFSLDVLKQDEQMAKHCNNLLPTHVYYFATPFVFGGRQGVFSEELFKRFCAYYVTGFEKIVSSLDTSGLKAVFYPSSVAVDELPLDMTEYIAAKQAGEAVCALLKKSRRGLVIRIARLPRLATDQTASVYPVENADPAQVMLTELRILATQ